MISIADKIAGADLQNKKFLDRIGTKLLFGIVAVAGIVAAAIGVNSSINAGGDLPQLSDNDDDNHVV